MKHLFRKSWFLVFLSSVLGCIVASALHGIIYYGLNKNVQTALSWSSVIFASCVFMNFIILSAIDYDLNKKKLWRVISRAQLYKYAVILGISVFTFGLIVFLCFFQEAVPINFELFDLPNEFLLIWLVAFVMMLPSILVGGVVSIFSLYFMNKKLIDKI